MRPMARWHLIFLRLLPFQRRRVTRDGLSTLCDIPATGTTPRPTAAGATGVSGPRHNHFCANAGGGEGSTEPLLQPIETAAAAEVGFKSYSSREICAPGLVNFTPTAKRTMLKVSTRKPRKSRVVFLVCSRGRYTRNPSLDIYLLSVQGFRVK